MSDTERAERLENRNILQVELAISELQRRLDSQIEDLSDIVLDHSATLDQLHGVMATEQTHGRGANVPLSPFHGNRNEDFVQYIKQFELICSANNFADDKKAQILASYLRDKAFYIYDSLTPEQKADYDELKAALGAKFQTTDYRRYAHQKFQERKQFATETVCDYGCDIHRLGLAALEKIESDQRDALIREKFIAGLIPELRELIIYSNPKSFHEAMTLAERLEGLQANKPDHSTKNILLLESISNRLANLEVQSKKSNSEETREIAYVVETPRERFGNNAVHQRRFNLGNFRQEFRPAGMVCYRCHRTGHMARNCPQNREMNSIVCRLCNRMGHYARNCQRRGPGLGRRSGPTPYRPPIGRSSFMFPSRPSVSNRTMALTVPQENDEAEQQEQPEVRRWQPLVAALWQSRRTTGQKIVEDPQADAVDSETISNILSHVTEQRTAALEISPTSSFCKSNQIDTLIMKGQDCPKDYAPKFRKMGQPVIAFKLWAAYIAICILVAILGVSGEDDQYLVHRTSGPMVCQTNQGKSLWRLPLSFNCPEGNHSAGTDVVQATLQMYKQNYIQYKSSAWKCVRITEEVSTFTYFFGDENLKKQNKIVEQVSAEDCTTMRNYKSCKGQPMIFQGGIYQTNNKLDWYYPGGGHNCCRWKKFAVSNCFMYQTTVYKRHRKPEMETSAGDVSNCKYKQGQCVLGDGSFLIWEVNNKSFCELLPWQQIDGKMYGTSWLADDNNLALTFTQTLKTVDCQGKTLALSDQGVAVKIVTPRPRERKVRQLNLDELKEFRKVIGTGGVVSSSQLAASLQALEMRWEENMRFAFSHALNNVCNFMRSVIDLLKTQVLANPTMAIRALTNQSDIFARSAGNIVEVFPCAQLNRNHYQLKPMNGTCSAQLPITFKINNKTNHGYLDPITNIIHRFSAPADCNLVKKVPVQLKDETYIYNSGDGSLTLADHVPALKILQWNIEPVIDMKATIFHEIVMYNWDELQTHISLNDIMGGLERQRTVLQHMGINSENAEPHEAAEDAVTKIMNIGYFGFLKGLTANLYQVWTFAVCLYVTICVVIVHCLPIRAIPAALNLGNAISSLKTKSQRWNWKRNIKRANRKRRRPVISEPSLLDRSQANIYMSELTERIAKRPALALPGPSRLQLMAPSAPVEEEMVPERQGLLSKFSWGKSTRTSADVQPFSVNTVSTGTSEIVINVCIEGMTVQTLVDTGSSLTIVPLKVAQQLKQPINKGSITAMSMTGHELHTIGEVETIIRIGNKDIAGKVVVTEESPYDLIIGTDLLKQFGAIKIDFKKKKIDFDVQSVPIMGNKRPIGVFLLQAIRILPQATVAVMGLCYGLTPAEVSAEPLCCFSPSEKLLTKYDIISQESIVAPRDKLIPVLLTNTDRSPKFVPEKATLGHVDVLAPCEVAMIRAQTSDSNLVVQSGTRRKPKEMQQFRQEIDIASPLVYRDRALLENLIEKYETLFAKTEYDLGETTMVEHTIDTADARPISQRPYRTPHSLRPYLSEKINEMLENGIIQPSKSNWSSPVVLVKKKDTTDLRFCVDNRKLNDVTIKDNYPLKRIEDAFDMLHNAKYFATLDLQSGYWQIPIKESDMSKTAFITGDGLYEFTKMNFGLCNAPATFQRLMDQVLRGLDLKTCMSYIDDIIVPAHTITQLVERLADIFERLMQAGLKLKLRKCKFGLQELKFLGFVVSKDGLKPDPEKIAKILNAVPPKSRDELRCFLGFAGWCKRFVESYAKVSEPLTDLLKQTKVYAWTLKAQTAFDIIKRLYSTPPILAYPNMEEPFIICTDASNSAIGAVLCQLDTSGKERPISYDGRVLNACERNYSTIEKEMLAIFWAVIKKYRVYVYGHAFTVFTDHKPLLGVWKSPPNEGRLGRWCIRMQEYRPNMTLQYREGKANVVADYLSRQPQPQHQIGHAMALAAVPETPSIRDAQIEDEIIGPVLKYLEEGEIPDDLSKAEMVNKWIPCCEIVDGILHKRSQKYRKLLVVLPKDLKRQVLIANHDSLLGGHLGVRKTLSKIEKKYFWPGYYKDVVEWCRSCMACQSRKPPAKYTKAPMQPIAVSYINQRWGWDICGPLPISQQGNKYILVCMEYFTKFPELFAVPDTKAERLAKIFVEHIVLRYGCPEVLISDQGTNVHSAMIQEICKMLDIDKLRTSAYHPQTDGMVERFNRTLQHMISMYINDGHTDWCEFLPFVAFAYRSSVHDSTKESPFYLMYGYDPILPVDQSLMPSHPGYISTDDNYKTYILHALLKSRRLVANNIAKQQQQQKQGYDKAAKEHTFLEGDRILVYTPIGKKGRSKKFGRNWKGPYRVLQVSDSPTEKQPIRREQKVTECSPYLLGQECQQRVRETSQSEMAKFQHGRSKWHARSTVQIFMDAVAAADLHNAESKFAYRLNRTDEEANFPILPPLRSCAPRAHDTSAAGRLGFISRCLQSGAKRICELKPGLDRSLHNQKLTETLEILGAATGVAISQLTYINRGQDNQFFKNVPISMKPQVPFRCGKYLAPFKPQQPATQANLSRLPVSTGWKYRSRPPSSYMQHRKLPNRQGPNPAARVHPTRSPNVQSSRNPRTQPQQRKYFYKRHLDKYAIL